MSWRPRSRVLGRDRGEAETSARHYLNKVGTGDKCDAYPILAMYFIIVTLIIIALFGTINKRLNRHLPTERRARLRIRPNLIR